MSGVKETPCRKFQANIFNKSKCQNCFKPRELHLLTDQDLNQLNPDSPVKDPPVGKECMPLAPCGNVSILHLWSTPSAKPIYGGWLCLAPEGTDFDNPMQRSRKWQRRFFVLYEHGCLRFALDESPSTLPQGTVNMNQCTDVIDAEPKTGQKNALCIITPEQEYFIRGENKEIINGWHEQLIVYPKTNKHNQKKKRKVEHTTSQEPGPAKVPVTGSGIPDAEKVPDSRSGIWQEELHTGEAEAVQGWPPSDSGSLGPALPLGGTASDSECVLNTFTLWWPVYKGNLFSIVFSKHSVMISSVIFFLSQTREVTAAELHSDHGSVNGDEVDRGGISFHAPPRHDTQVLSPTGSTSSRHSAELGGIPRCPSPAQSDPFPSGSSLLSNGSHISGSMSSLDSDASGSTVTSTDSHHGDLRAQRTSALLEASRSRRHEAESRKTEKRRVRSPEQPEGEPEKSRSTVIEKLEALELDNAERMEVEEESGRSAARQGRSETRRFQREEQKRDSTRGLNFHHSTIPPLRRAKSLDRRTTESVMTPDLLNFKKGWMVKLDDQGQWKKYWFVLTDHSLRYYKDSIAEEASDLDGEIDLTTCYSVTEYQVQRNYGFQIHTQEAVYTLSAMTAGIRRNWIQAVMKNVRPSTAPDVARSIPFIQMDVFQELLPDDCGSSTPLDSLLKPDVTHDSPSSEASSAERDPGQKRSRARERRREGRSKTFDWAEFRPIAQAMAKQRTGEVDALQSDLTDLERTKRREERRKRYEVVTGTLEPTASPAADPSHMDVEGCGASSVLERQRRVQDEIEQHWQQVEKTPIREERRVPLASALQAKETAELERLLDSYKKGVEELRAQLESCHQQLADSHYRKLELEAQLSSALEREQHIRSGYVSPKESTVNELVTSALESPLGLEAELESQKKRQELISSQAQNLKKKYQETKELLQQQEVKKRSMQAQLGLSLSELSARELSPAKSLNTFISETQGITDAPGELTQTAKRFSIVLQDSEEKLEELQSLISSSPLTVNGLVQLLATYMGDEHGTPGSKTCCQKLYDSLKQQQDLEHEALKQNLAKAGESVREYEARLQSMEGMLGRVQRQKLDNLKSCAALRQMEEHVELSEATVKRLAQEVELLTNENEVLNQRYQEIVNQLTEADREIERLKIELFNQQGGQQYLQVVEELNKLKTKLAEKETDFIDKDFYEQELSKKSQKLQDALIKLEVLGSSLKETERKLHLKEATLKGLGFQMTEDNDAQLLLEEKECLLKQLAGAEARIADQEKQLEVLEQSRGEFESQYRELKLKRAESESMYSQKLLEAEGKIRELEEEIEGLRRSVSGHGCTEKKEGLASSVTDEERIEQVVEKIKLKSAALSKVSEVLEKVDIRVGKVVSELKRYVQSSSSSLELGDSSEKESPEEHQLVLRKLLLEGEFWGNMLNISEANLEELKANELTGSFLCEMAENAFVEKKMLLLAHSLIHLSGAQQPKMGLELVNDLNRAPAVDEVGKKQKGNHGKEETMHNYQGDTEVKNKEDLLNLYNWLDNDTDNVVRKGLIQILQRKVSLLTHIASAIQSSSDDELVALGLRLFDGLDFKSQMEPWLASLQDAVMQAQLSYLICRLDVQHDRELSKLKETEPGAGRMNEMDCKNCAEIKRQNEDFKIKVDSLHKEIAGLRSPMGMENMPVTRIQIEGEPIDSLDKAIQLQDMAAKHKRELREVKDAYELEAEKLRQEIGKAGEILRLKSEENVKEIDSLTVCMENLKTKHETELKRQQEQSLADRHSLEQRFESEMEKLKAELRGCGSAEENKPHSMLLLKERIQELESQVTAMKAEVEDRKREGDMSSLQQKYEKDLENLKATCERGFAAMEESHQKVIEELQRKHQRELENLKEEKERLLAEETAATIAAIEAMKNAHRTELERELDKARKANSNTENADIEEIRLQHEEELASFQREIEVLSEQYSQKCLENAHLAQALEAERQALRQCQRENQELNAHNQELNNRLAAEITKLRSMVTSEDSGDSCTLIHGKEVYELEVMLRVKESEVQYLKQEINSLKDELQTAQRDKKYATDKYKDIYTELSIVKAKAERDIGRLRDQLQQAHEALGEPSLEDTERSGYGRVRSATWW
ncbi:MPRIP protein, partial [Atractosteus spatula]|nr:MPRIP protein [Atractosteus spatula]